MTTVPLLPEPGRKLIAKYLADLETIGRIRYGSADRMVQEFARDLAAAFDEQYQVCFANIKVSGYISHEGEERNRPMMKGDY